MNVKRAATAKPHHPEKRLAFSQSQSHNKSGGEIDVIAQLEKMKLNCSVAEGIVISS